MSFKYGAALFGAAAFQPQGVWRSNEPIVGQLGIGCIFQPASCRQHQVIERRTNGRQVRFIAAPLHRDT